MMEIDSSSIEEYSLPKYTEKMCVKLFNRTQLDGEWRDVTMVAGIDQQKIRAHRVILSTASPYFDAMLMGDMREAQEDVVTLAHIDGSTLQALIRFCYLGKIEISNNVEELLAAASSMELVQLEWLCERHCLKLLSRDNCLRFWMLADRFSLNLLKTNAYKAALDYFTLIVAGMQFVQLTNVLLQQLLTDNNLSVASEVDVFGAVVRWVRHDEHNRKQHFTELVSSVVRVKEMKVECLSRILLPCGCWMSSEMIVRILNICHSAENTVSSRLSIQHPTPMVIGSDANLDRDLFTIEKLSHLEQDFVEWVSFAGYRSCNSTLQVGQQLYILGGIDADGNTLNRVQVVNVRDWNVADVKPMRYPRADFDSVHLDGSIYAIGGNFATETATENINLTFERYDIAKNEWSDVTQINFFGQTPRHIHAVVYAGRIAVIYPGGMSFYDPMCNKWHREAGIPELNLEMETFCDIYIHEDQLVVNFNNANGSVRYQSKYMALENRWTTLKFLGECNVLTLVQHGGMWKIRMNQLENGSIDFEYYSKQPNKTENKVYKFNTKTYYSDEEKLCIERQLKIIVMP